MESALDLLLAVVIGSALAGAVVAMARRPDAAPAPAPAAPAPRPPRARAADGVAGDFLAAFTEKVMHGATNPLWWRDADLNLAGANDCYARSVGAPSAAEAVRLGLELAPAARSLAARARASGRTAFTEERVVIAGERRVMDIIHVPLPGGMVAGLALDPRQRDGEAAGAPNGLAAAALEAAPAGLAVFDAGRRLRRHNATFARTFALDPELLAQAPDFDRVLEAGRDARRLPETRDFPGWRQERGTWFALAAGEEREERWTLPTGETLRVTARGLDGGGLVLAAEDRTEAVALAGARDALAASRQAIVDGLDDGVAVFGPDGAIRLFNARFAEIVAVPPGQLSELPWAQTVMTRVAELLTEPERAQGLPGLIAGATGDRVARAGRLTSTLGYVIDYRATPLPDGDALMVLRDVTPRPA